MNLPSADELRSIFAAAREHGVTHLRVGGLEVRLAPLPPAPAVPAESPRPADLIAEINRAAPLPGSEDPTPLLRAQVNDSHKRTLSDPLDVISTGGRLLVDSALGS